MEYYFIHMRTDLCLSLDSVDGNIVIDTVIFIIIVPGVNGPEELAMCANVPSHRLNPIIPP